MPGILSRIKYFALVLLLILAAYNISRTTLEIYKSSRRLSEIEEEVKAKKNANATLKERLKYALTNEFVEKEARNKLNLVKPGEKILIPASDIKHAGQEQGSPASFGQNEVEKKSNFEKWFGLFFDSR